MAFIRQSHRIRLFDGTVKPLSQLADDDVADDDASGRVIKAYRRPYTGPMIEVVFTHGESIYFAPRSKVLVFRRVVDLDENGDPMIPRPPINSPTFVEARSLWPGDWVRFRAPPGEQHRGRVRSIHRVLTSNEDLCALVTQSDDNAWSFVQGIACKTLPALAGDPD